MYPNIIRNAVLFAICSFALIGSAMSDQSNDTPVAGTVTLGVAVEQGLVAVERLDAVDIAHVVRKSAKNPQPQVEIESRLKRLVESPQGVQELATHEYRRLRDNLP